VEETDELEEDEDWVDDAMNLAMLICAAAPSILLFLLLVYLLMYH